MGRDFRWLWAAFAASTAGTYLALDAFPLIAILVLHSSTAQVSLLAAAGLAAGALIAVPLGGWVEFRRKRPVMIGTDLLRFGVLLTVPAAYALGVLTFGQLVVVSTVAAAANIAFTSASGANLKGLVPKADLLTANGRFESTLWTATAIGPPLGGAAIGVFGPVTTVILNAVSFLLSAAGVTAIRTPEPVPPVRSGRRESLLHGWRHLLSHRLLRPLFLNVVLVNSLIMAAAPLLAVLLLRELHFTTLEYGLAFGVPCLGGLLGSRLARPLVRAYGARRILLVTGTVRVLWPVGLALIPAGPGGLLLVMAIEFALITSIGVFNPVLVTFRLEHTSSDRVARVLSAWSVTTQLTIAALTVAGGLIAHVLGVRPTIALAGVLLLATPALLPWRRSRMADEGIEPDHELSGGGADRRVQRHR